MSQDKFYMTVNGLQDLEKELTYLKNVKRVEITQAIARARDFGDLSENAEYIEAKREQSLIESKISNLEDKFSRSVAINPANMSGDIVKFGATVELLDLDQERKKSYQIVSDYEADLARGFLSLKAPLAKALIGRKQADYFELETPGGTKEYQIVNVSYV